MLSCLGKFSFCYSGYDLTLVGPMLFFESLSGLSVGIIDALKDDLKINFIPTSATINFDGIPNKVQYIVQHSNNSSNSSAKVVLFTEILWTIAGSQVDKMPKGNITIAYSMLESTAIPSEWVTILNTKFDAVVVPDPFLKTVYQNSGVKIPIFVLPCGISIDDLLTRPLKKAQQTPFIFGMSALASSHKNFMLLADAFIQEFNNDPNVKLVLHDRTESSAFFDEIYKKIESLHITNISILPQRFSRSMYQDFLSSLDCYVLLSKGEGFSITPREALALGIPCILSNNSAHITLCKSKLVRVVDSSIAEPAYYVHLGGVHGFQFNCTIQDVQRALRDVYVNYQLYLAKAHQGREWVKQYLYRNLKRKYLNLVRPSKVKLGKDNVISDNYIMTNSQSLYKKYKKLRRQICL